MIRLLRLYPVEIIIIFWGSLHQLFQKVLMINIPWIDYYFDDLIAVPFISGTVVIIENVLIYKNHFRRHHIYQLSFIFLALALVFEWILPAHNAVYVSDPYDIVCYLTGGSFYYLYLNKKDLIKRSF